MATELRPLPRRSLPPLGADTSQNIGTSEQQTTNVQGSEVKKPRRKRRTARSPQLDDTNNETIGSNKDQSEANTEILQDVSNVSINARSRRRQANRKTKQPRPTVDIVTNGHAITKMLSEDDVVPVDRIEAVSMSTLPGIAGNSGNSQPQGRVYVQTTSGFAPHTNDWLVARQTHQEKKLLQEEQIAITKTPDVAISYHRGFLFFSLLLHGLLAGFSLWETVVAFVLNGISDTNFFIQFQFLSQPLQTTFYLFLIFCLVSALDRFKFSKKGLGYFGSLLRFQHQAWTVAVYFLSLMFSVGMSGLDEWLATGTPPLPFLNTTMTSSYLNGLDNGAGTLRTWHILNVFRSSFALIGWLLIALNPGYEDTASRWWCCQFLVKTFGVTNRGNLPATQNNPGVEIFAPVSNIRLWGLQMLAVSIPGSLYFVYVLHLVSRKKESDAENNQRTNDSVKEIRVIGKLLPSAHRRWKKLTGHVIPPELHKSRAKHVWRLYILQLIARIMLECLFVAWQYTSYYYRWTVPEVIQCTDWPCPHIVDCFISRPREKTLFLRYMYLVSAFSVILSLAEIIYITWTCARRTCVVEHDQSTNHGERTCSPLYGSRDLWLESGLKHHHGAVVTSDLDSVADSDVTTPPLTPDEDYVDMQPVGRVSYL